MKFVYISANYATEICVYDKEEWTHKVHIFEICDSIVGTCNFTKDFGCWIISRINSWSCKQLQFTKIVIWNFRSEVEIWKSQVKVKIFLPLQSIMQSLPITMSTIEPSMVLGQYLYIEHNDSSHCYPSSYLSSCPLANKTKLLYICHVLLLPRRLWMLQTNS